MKKPEIKIKIKRPDIDLAKKMPYIFIVIFLVVGLAMVVFGYFALNRTPNEGVISGVQKEIDDLSPKFDKKKINKLFDASYSTSKIKEPFFKPKNPFTGF